MQGDTWRYISGTNTEDRLKTKLVLLTRKNIKKLIMIMPFKIKYSVCLRGNNIVSHLWQSSLYMISVTLYFSCNYEGRKKL